MRRRPSALLAVAVAAGAVALAPLGGPATGQGEGPRCEPGAGPVVVEGTAPAEQAGTFVVRPFEVGEGTTRVEVTYDWTEPEGGATVLDLGLWDDDGYREVEGFRGWSGSRVGRTADDQLPVFVQQDEAARGYHPAPIEAGTWWLDVGLAAIGPAGTEWSATITCTDPEVGDPFEADPVDRELVLADEAGWYHADLHVHGYHSSPRAPDWDELVDMARAAGLDVLPITDYVTGQQWEELGSVQERHDDVLLWPGREIITYDGHVNALGETPSILEYRHGFEDVTMAGIQDATLADGALFQVNHPTSFPEPLAASCRGCEFRLGDDVEGGVDWSRVDTIEVLNGPVRFTLSDIGVEGDDTEIPNPFTDTAVELWESLLQDGHRITAVSGSDSKADEDPADRDRRGVGASATAIYADALSRPALEEALRDGHAYVRTEGVDTSPALELSVAAPDVGEVIMGDSLPADEATMTVTVEGGEGQELRVVRNGEVVSTTPLPSDRVTTEIPLTRDPAGEGPLGTWWRVETVAADGVRTTIANPVFLTGVGGESDVPDPDAEEADESAGEAPDDTTATTSATTDTGGEGGGFPVVAVVLAAVVVVVGTVSALRYAAGRRTARR